MIKAKKILLVLYIVSASLVIISCIKKENSPVDTIQTTPKDSETSFIIPEITPPINSDLFGDNTVSPETVEVTKRTEQATSPETAPPTFTPNVEGYDFQIPQRITNYKVYFGSTDNASSCQDLMITSMSELNDMIQNKINANVSSELFPETLYDITRKYTEEFFETNILCFHSDKLRNHLIFEDELYISSNDEYIEALYSPKAIKSPEPDHGNPYSVAHDIYFLIEIPKEVYYDEKTEFYGTTPMYSRIVHNGSRLYTRRLLEETRFPTEPQTTYYRRMRVRAKVIETAWFKETLEHIIHYFSYNVDVSDALRDSQLPQVLEYYNKYFS